MFLIYSTQSESYQEVEAVLAQYSKRSQKTHPLSKDMKNRLRMMIKLGLIRLRALPVLVKLAGNRNEYVRQAAAQGLGEYVKTALPEERTQILPLLFKLAGDWDRDVRQAAAQGLAWIEGEQTISILPKLTELLHTLVQDSNTTIQSYAKIAFAKLQTRFNLANTLQQIAQEREIEEKNIHLLFLRLC